MAIAGVYPFVPTASSAITVVIHDHYSGTSQGGLAAVGNVAWRIDGNVISVTAELVDPQGTTQPPIRVALPPLPEGRYVVRYDGSKNLPNPERHRSTTEFSVSNAGYATAIEFHHSALDHYFITANPDEIAKLDQGTIKGWTRTGEQFRVLAPETAPTTAGPVCRMYGVPEAGLDSHFFAEQRVGGLRECDEVLRRWPREWILETPMAFATPPTFFGGNESLTTCGDDGQPLYRLYSNRPDANHRYTVSRRIRDEMLAQGWILEGPTYDFQPIVPNDIRQIAMCVLR